MGCIGKLLETPDNVVGNTNELISDVSLKIDCFVVYIIYLLVQFQFDKDSEQISSGEKQRS